MNPVIIGVIGILFLFFLLAMRMQVGFAMALVGFLGFAILSSYESSAMIISMEPFKIGSAYSLSVVPLFILMAQFANHSKMGFEIYQTMYRWIGFLPGGLSMATIGGCAGFSAISGSSVATAVTMGMVSLPEMKRFGYADSLATGGLAAGGTLGILIPPSTIMILYGILTEQSFGQLFIAGIIPGILLSGFFMASVYIMAKINPKLAPPGPRFTLKEKLFALKDTWGILSLFILVMGGLYTGWFTPSEAGGVGAFGAFTIAILRRRLNMGNLKDSLSSTIGTTAMVFAILIGAHIFGYFLTISEIPDQLSGWIAGLGYNRFIIISIIIVIYVILGCFMEGYAIMVLTIPIIYPLVLDLGFDPIWFGIIITLVIEMGLITPPLGINVFVIGGIADGVPMYTIFKGIIPFWIAMMVCVVILIIFPQIALFLPASMSG